MEEGGVVPLFLRVERGTKLEDVLLVNFVGKWDGWGNGGGGESVPSLIRSFSKELG
jgi:hypothetical protein